MRLGLSTLHDRLQVGRRIADEGEKLLFELLRATRCSEVMVDFVTDSGKPLLDLGGVYSVKEELLCHAPIAIIPGGS